MMLNGVVPAGQLPGTFCGRLCAVARVGFVLPLFGSDCLHPLLITLIADAAHNPAAVVNISRRLIFINFPSLLLMLKNGMEYKNNLGCNESRTHGKVDTFCRLFSRAEEVQLGQR